MSSKCSGIQASRNPRWWPHKRWGTERIYYLSHNLYVKGYRRLAYLLKYLNIFIFRSYIPPEVVIGKRLDMPHGGFGIVLQKETVIGDDAIIFHNVTMANGGTRIGDRVYIGAGAVIIGPVNVGDDVTIGANTVVNFDVPNKSTVVGTAGRLVNMKDTFCHDMQE